KAPREQPTDSSRTASAPGVVPATLPNSSVAETAVLVPNSALFSSLGTATEAVRIAAAPFGEVLHRTISASVEIRIDPHLGPATSGNDQAEPLPVTRAAPPLSEGEPSEPPAAVSMGKPSLAELLTPSAWDASAA